MSLIEQAAKRLEQLRQAGVELPDDESLTNVSGGVLNGKGPEPTPPPLCQANQLRLHYPPTHFLNPLVAEARPSG